ncbi:hypothetical protein [Thermoactinospora rubra]|uniref:hypothetical protein n=1 Tax=Thermoactinospora rubra TaxID=1088767 RepID=UPI000A0F8009|nr:hypothetical protein [Thermoactinospora rubra]
MSDDLRVTDLHRLTLCTDGGTTGPGSTSVTYVSHDTAEWALTEALRRDRGPGDHELVTVHHDGGHHGNGAAVTAYLTRADREQLAAEIAAQRVA